MSDNKTFDFASFVSANVGRIVSGFDYLHVVYKSQGLAADFILWFSKLFWPDFKTVDGVIFVSELFNAERYQELLNNGNSATQAQFWMNLLEITGLFDDLSTDQAMDIAEVLAESWNSKLEKEVKPSPTLARAIRDEETGEVFVTIGIPD